MSESNRVSGSIRSIGGNNKAGAGNAGSGTVLRRWRGARSATLLAAAVAAASVSGIARYAPAANGTWLNTGTTTGWFTSTNWVSGNIPGTNVSGSTTNTDAALFNTAVGTVGANTSNAIVLPTSFNIQNINFDTNAGSYVVGTNAGNSIYLTAGGGIQILSTLSGSSAVTETINAPISLAGGAGTYSFINNSANGTGAGAGTLSLYQIAGAASTTLMLGGSNTNGNSISALISGGTFINKTGAGTWTLGDGVNSYTGGTQISGGTLIVAMSGNLDSIGNGTGTLTLAGGTLTNGYGTGNVSNPVLVAAGTTSSVNASSAGNIQITGAITGSGTLQNNTTTSASTLIMGDISGFTGTFNYVDNGASAQNMYFASSGSVANASLGSLATFNLSGSTTAGRQLTVGNSNVFQMGALSGTGGLLAISGTLQVGYLNNSTGFSGVITGGALTKVGTGTLSLGNAMSYTGTTTVSAGTLQFSSGSSYTGAAAGSMFVVNGGSLNFNMGSGTATFYGDGYASAMAIGDGGYAGTPTGTVTLYSGTVNISTKTSGTTAGLRLGGNSASASGTLIVNGGTLNVPGRILMAANGTSTTASTLTVNGGTVNMGTVGSGSYTDPGAGVLWFGGGVSTVNLNGGTLALYSLYDPSAGSNVTVNLNGGTLKAIASNTTFINVTAGTLTLKDTTGGITINPASYSITISTALTHDSGLGGTADGGLIVNDTVGGGTLVLTATNTYTGPTTITAGTLQIGNGGTTGTLGTAASVANNGTLNFNFNNSQTISTLITGSGTLGQTGPGTTNLTNTANTYTGVTDISAGILNVAQFSNYGVPGSLGNRSAGSETSTGDGIGIHLGLGTVGGTLQYTGATAQSTNRQIRLSAANNTIDASGSVPAATVSFTYNGSNTNFYETSGARTLTLTGTNTGVNLFAINITDLGSGSNATSFVKAGTGTWELTGGSSNFTGGANISNGTLIAASTTALGGSTATIQSAGTLQLNVSSGSTWNFGNAIAGGGNLVFSGTATTIVTGTNNTFFGSTSIAPGSTMQLGSNVALQNSLLTVPVGGTLSFGNLIDPVLGGFNGSGNYTLPSGIDQFTFSPAAGVTSTLAGNFSGPSLVTLVKTGAGTDVIGGNALNTGATNIYGGGLQFSSDAAIGGSGANVTVYPGVAFTGGFAIDQAFLGRIASPTTSYGVVALGANDSQNLNFNSSSLTNASLGAVGTQTYSGTLTPNGTTYRLGGGGGTLILSSALTGASNTLQINPSVASNTTVSLTSTANTLGGAVTVSSGTLLLDYTGTNTGATILNNNALSMGGATLSVLGTNTGGQNTTQSFASLALTTGKNSIVDTAPGTGSSTVNLGTITRSAGAAADFTLPASGSINVKNANTNGILGGYATVGGTTWAVSAGNGTTAGAISGLSTYTTTATASTTASNYSNGNIDVTTSVAPAAVITPNSLRFNTAAATTLTMNAGTNTLASGGILVTANVGNNLSTITGGTLNVNGSGGKDVVITNNDTQSQLTISSLINTGVTKTGPGTVVLTGGSYGPYYGDGGVLNLASNGTLAYNSAIANNGGTIIIGALDNEQYVNLQPNSGGTILENSTTYANTFTFNGGTIGGTGYFNDQAVGGSGWTAVAGSSSVLSTSTVFLNTIIPVNLNAGSVLTVSSTLTNSGLNIFGSGTMILTGNNTFTNTITIGGTTVVQAGSADTGTSGPLGNGGQINLSGGTLQWSPVNSYDYSSRFNTAAGKTYSFDTNGQNVNFATALISTGAPLTKLGAGTLTLNGANTLSGATSIKAGTLALGATGTLANTTGVSIASGATFDISAATAPFNLSSASATLGGSGTVIGNYTHTMGILSPGGTGTVGTMTFNNNLALAGGTVNLDLNGSSNVTGGTANDLISVGGNLNLSSPTAVVVNFTGGIPAPGTIYDLINYTGTLTGALTNLLPPSRTTQIIQGTNQIDLQITSGTGANLYWNGTNGTWDVQTSLDWFNTGTSGNDYFYSNDNVNFNDASGVSTSINLTTSLSPGSITVSSNTNNYTFGGSGSIIGSGGLTMSGSSTLTMNTSNSYSGSTNAAGGVIVVNAATGLGNGALTIGLAGTVQVTSSGTLGNSSVTVNGIATVNNSSGNGLGTGALTIGPSGSVSVGSGGTAGSLANSSYVVNGSLTYNLSSGATLSTPYSGSGAITFTGGNSYSLNGNSSSYNGSIGILSGNLYTGSVTNPLGTGTVNVSGGKLYTTTGLSIVNPLILGTSGISIEAGGNKTSTFTGPVTIAANTQFFVDGGSTLLLNGAVTGNNFNVSTAGATGNALYLGGSWNLGSGTLTTGDEVHFTPASGQTITIASDVSGSSNLVLSGPGTTVLQGANTFGGSTFLQGGILQVSQIADSGPSNLGNTGNLYLYGPTTFEVTAGNSTTGRSVYVLGTGAANIKVDSGASLTLSGNFQYFGSGTNNFNVSGGGTLALTGNYAGPWNTLNSVSGAGTTVVLGAAVNQVNDIGAGATVKFNSSTAVTYAGGSGVGINSGGTLNMNGFNQSISALNSTNSAALVTNNGSSGATLTIGNSTNNLSSSFAGGLTDGASPLSVTTAGTGTLTLSGSSTYSGPTTVSAGILRLSGSLASTNLSVASGAVFTALTGGTIANATALSDSGTVNFNNATPTIATLNGGGNLNLNGTSLTITGGGTFSGKIASTGSLLSTGGLLTLSGSNTYSGSTTVSAGTLIAGSATALSPNSALNIVGGTVDVSNYSSGVNSLTLSSGNLNLGVGNVLTSSTFANFSGGTINVGGSSLTLGDYKLIQAGSPIGSLGSVAGTIPAQYVLAVNGSDLDLQHVSTFGAVTATAGSSQMIVGGSVPISFNVSNTSPAGSASLNFTTTAGTNVTGTVAGPTSVAAGSLSATQTGLSFSSTAFGAQTGTFTVSDVNSSNGSVTGSVSVTVLDHALGSLSNTTGDNQTVITGATGLTGSVQVAAAETSANGTRAGLQVTGTSSNLTGYTGVIPAGSSKSLTASFNAPSGFGTQSVAYSVTAGDDQSLPGASAPAAIAGTFSVNVLDHALGSLSNTAGDNQTVITGATGLTGSVQVAAAATSANGTRAGLQVTGTSSNLTGYTGVIPAGSTQSLTANFNAPSGFGTQSVAYSVTAGDDQSLPGASAPAAIAGSFSVNVLDHALGSLSNTAGDNQTVITGATDLTGSVQVAAAATSANGTRAGLQVTGSSSNLTGFSGVIPAGSSQSLTASFNAPSGFGSQSVAYSVTAGDDQSLPGASAPAAIAGTFSVNVLDHALGSLSNTAGDNQTVITGATGLTGSVQVAAAATSSNGTRAGLQVTGTSSNLTSFTGVIPAGSSQSLTASFNAPSGFGSQSVAYSVTAGDDQGLPGASAPSAIAGTFSVNVLDHALGSLSNTAGDNQTVITGATGLTGSVQVAAAATSANGTRAGLQVTGTSSNLTSFTGVIPAGGTQPLTASFNAPSGFGTQSVAYSVTAGDDQSLPGGSAPAAIAGSFSVNVLDHALGSLSNIAGDNQTVITGATGLTGSVKVSAAATSANGARAGLQVTGTSSNLTGFTGVIAAGGSQSLTASFNAPSGFGSQSVAYIVTAGDDQSLPGASAPSAIAGTFSVNVLDHAHPALDAAGDTTLLTNIVLPSIIAGATAPAGSVSIYDLPASVSAALTAGLSLTGDHGSNSAFTLASLPGSVIPASSSSAYSLGLGLVSTTTPGTYTQTFTINTSDDTSLTGASSASDLVFTVQETINPAGPANLVWKNSAATGVWNTSDANWNSSTGTVAYSDTSNSTLGDRVTYDDNNGGNYSVTINGTGHPTSVTFANTTGSYTLAGATGSSGIAGTTALTLTGAGTVTLSSNNSYTGGTVVNAGKLVLASANAFPANTALSVASGASVTVANHTGGSSYVPTLSSLSNNGAIDITNNAMVIHNAGASIGTYNAQVANAFNGGAWNGTSASSGIITSSWAASDPSHLTSVGVATGLTTFEDGSVAASDVLIKYTYYGDANLTGTVDSADYARIDNGYLSNLTGWQNGDFNYDGVINGSDFTLIDNAFNSQGAAIASQLAAPTAQIAGAGTSSAVPEPTSLGLLGIGVAGLLGRRSKRR